VDILYIIYGLYILKNEFQAPDLEKTEQKHSIIGQESSFLSFITTL